MWCRGRSRTAASHPEETLCLGDYQILLLQATHFLERKTSLNCPHFESFFPSYAYSHFPKSILTTELNEFVLSGRHSCQDYLTFSLRAQPFAFIWATVGANSQNGSFLLTATYKCFFPYRAEATLPPISHGLQSRQTPTSAPNQQASEINRFSLERRHSRQTGYVPEQFISKAIYLINLARPGWC